MSRLYSVEKLLTDRQLEQFRTMAIDRRTTVDELHEWIIARGHQICRSAVGNFRAHVCQRSAFRFIAFTKCNSEAGKRRQIANWALQLSGEPLSAVLHFAAYQINLQAAWASRPSESLPTFEPAPGSEQEG